jgi:plastocyanin
MQNLRSRYVRGYALALLALLAGCAGHKQAINVTAAAPGQKVPVQMKAGNFYFDPAVIVARTGDTLVLNVTNVSGETHNLTVKDPAGNTLKSEDLPAHQTVTMEIPLAAAGVYPFYCDKPFHAALGMKGRIEVQ